MHTFRDAVAAVAALRTGDPAHQKRLAFWVEAFGETPLDQVSRDDVAEAFDRLSRTRKLKVVRIAKGVATVAETDQTIAPATANRYLASLGTFFADARRAGLLRRGHAIPTRGLERLPPGPGRTVRVTTADVLHLIAWCRLSRSPWLAALVATAATTGVRLGNLTGARWHDTDLAAGTLDIPKTKNGTAHRAVLLPFVLDEIQRWRKLSGATRPGDLIFPVGNPNSALRTALKRANLPTSWSFHSLRHVAASVLAQSGASVSEIMATLNHRSPSMALRYSHLNPESQRRALAGAWGAK
jgi:integrase